MRLRPYKPCDGDVIASWLTDEQTFAMWSAYRYQYPMTGEQFNARLDCARDNPCEFMMTALNDDGEPVGYFLLRNADWELNSVHMGFIVVNAGRRGKGYGTQMLTLAKHFCFDILGMERITLGVFEPNERARRCYERLGFTPYAVEDADFEYRGQRWKVIEMECLKEHE